MNVISIRLLSQQLASPLFSTPDEVVSHFGAMQAQDYRMMRWAVSMRTATLSAAAFRSAFDEGRWHPFGRKCVRRPFQTEHF